jgi:hypothetical protein
LRIECGGYFLVEQLRGYSSSPQFVGQHETEGAAPNDDDIYAFLHAPRPLIPEPPCNRAGRPLTPDRSGVCLLQGVIISQPP